MKRLLLMAHYFPPVAGVGVQRPASFTRHLPEFGWEVTVVRAPIPLNARVDTVDLGSARVVEAGLSNLGPIRDRGARWVLPVLRTVSRLVVEWRPHALMCTGGPFIPFLVPLLIKKRYGIPYVLDFRDPWSLNPYMEPRSLKGKMARTLEKHLEAIAVAGAEIVLSVSARMTSDLADAHPTVPRSRFQTLYNGYDEGEFATLKPVDLPKHQYHIVYTGTAGDPHYPFGKMFRALQMLLYDNPDMRAVICLHLIGNVSMEYQQMIERLGLQDVVKCHGFQPHRETLRYLLAADLLFLLIDNSAGQGNLLYDVSGKVFEYIRAGKPVLAQVPRNGEAFQILSRAGLLLHVDSAEIALARALNQQVGRTNVLDIDTAFVRTFERRAQVKDLAGILERLSCAGW